MKALMYTAPMELIYRDVADPVAKAGEVIVKIEGVGICGSDLHAYKGEDERRRPPLILGHEPIGRIISGPQKARRVAINPLVTCGTCAYCRRGREQICQTRQIISMSPRPGAFADYVCIPDRNVFEVSEDTDASRIALAEPLAVSVHAVNLGFKLLDIPFPEAKCVVVGGGPIGLLVAYALGFQDIVGTLIVENNAMRRRQIGERVHFKAVSVDCGELVESGFDLIIDAVGSSATRALACHIARPGGVVVHVGLHERDSGIDARKLTIREIIYTGSYCYTPAEFKLAVAMLESGRLGAFDWIEERELREGARAFADLTNAATSGIKLILRP